MTRDLKIRTLKRLLLCLLLLPCCLFAQQGSPAIRTGAEELFSHEYAVYGGLRLAVVGNQASQVGGTHLVDTLLARGAKVVKIFCPEHGFRGTAEAGAQVGNSTDPRTGLPIISLYGKNKKPSRGHLADVDIVIFDLQDVGCRFYTYISTLHYVMEACAESGLPLLVLDRPNPNAGYVDGPVMESEYRSFVGMHEGVPVVYGMTIGEYALMINGQRWLADSAQCRLAVVPMRNYSHDSVCRLSVPPSPNLRTDHAIALYPSLCLFEGTNVSVGRGTDSPFEVVGCPSYADHAFSFTPRPVEGASLNPPFNGRKCYGLDLRDEPAPRCFDLRYLLVLYEGSNRDAFFLKSNFFEKLAGTAALRRQIVDGVGEEAIRASWQPGLDRFMEIRRKYLLYN